MTSYVLILALIAIPATIFFVNRGREVWQPTTDEHHMMLARIGMPKVIHDMIDDEDIHEVLDYACKCPDEKLYELRHGEFREQDKSVVTPLWQSFSESAVCHIADGPEGTFIKVYLGESDTGSPFDPYLRRDGLTRRVRELGEMEALGSDLQCALADLFIMLSKREPEPGPLRAAARAMGFLHLDRMRKELRSKEATDDLPAWRRRFLASCEPKGKKLGRKSSVQNAEPAKRQKWIPEKLYRRHPDLVDEQPAQPFPDSWRGVLLDRVALYRDLDPPHRETLERLTLSFMDQVTFEGCGGFELDDEHRVIVAAQASALLLGRRDLRFSRLRSVLIYPEAYFVDHPEDRRAGESWDTGDVVLAWEEVLRGAGDGSDGYNVVIHELAHQLDQGDAVSDGIPVPVGSEYHRAWEELIDRHFEGMVARLGRGEDHVLDAYGATHRVEFFAVATEAFFEKPEPLCRALPDLYAHLSEFFGLDPRTWGSA